MTEPFLFCLSHRAKQFLHKSEILIQAENMKVVPYIQHTIVVKKKLTNDANLNACINDGPIYFCFACSKALDNALQLLLNNCIILLIIVEMFNFYSLNSLDSLKEHHMMNNLCW